MQRQRETEVKANFLSRNTETGYQALIDPRSSLQPNESVEFHFEISLIALLLKTNTQIPITNHRKGSKKVTPFPVTNSLFQKGLIPM